MPFVKTFWQVAFAWKARIEMCELLTEESPLCGRAGSCSQRELSPMLLASHVLSATLVVTAFHRMHPVGSYNFLQVFGFGMGLAKP